MVVEVAGNAFAIPAWAVDRVTVLVPVTPLPLVPPYVDGLVGLGGAIVPQIDLRRRLALAAASAGDGGELLVVAAAGGSYALRVDRVLTLTVAAPGAIRVFSGATGDGSLQPGVIVGEMPWRQGRTALVLHPDRLGLEELAARAGDGPRATPPASPIGPIAAVEVAAVEPRHVYVLARCGQACVALPVAQVAEVVARGPLTPVPGAPPGFLGVARLRDRSLPVLAPAEATAEASVLIVVDSTSGRFALAVDAVVGVRAFALSCIHAGAGAGGQGRSGYLVDAGDRVIGLLDADRMAAGGRAAGWRNLVSPEVTPTDPVAPEATRQLLVFRVGTEWCALDAATVIRLTGYRPPQPVPLADAGFAGVVEIGAEVLPMLDLRTELGAPATVSDWTALIVVETSDGRWALAVDRIDRLVVVPVSAVQSASAPVHRLLGAIVRVGDRVISLLDLASLFKD